MKRHRMDAAAVMVVIFAVGVGFVVTDAVGSTLAGIGGGMIALPVSAVILWFLARSC